VTDLTVCPSYGGYGPIVHPGSGRIRHEAAEGPRSDDSISYMEGDMPERETLERAREDAREGKSPSTQAGEFVNRLEPLRIGEEGGAHEGAGPTEGRGAQGGTDAGAAPVELGVGARQRLWTTSPESIRTRPPRRLALPTRIRRLKAEGSPSASYSGPRWSW